MQMAANNFKLTMITANDVIKNNIVIKITNLIDLNL